MRTTNHLLLFLSLVVFNFIISSCSDNRCIQFDYIVPINDTLNIYVFHKTTSTHTENESNLAIGQNKCEILNDSTRTFAKSEGFVQIDTVLNKKIYISSWHKISFFYKPEYVTFEIKELNIKDGVKPTLQYVLACSDSCH